MAVLNFEPGIYACGGGKASHNWRLYDRLARKDEIPVIKQGFDEKTLALPARAGFSEGQQETDA
ncbi:MAG: hypothetical protein V3V30_02835 [Parvularculaceae bacterium]